MLASLVRVSTKDGIELQGLNYKSSIGNSDTAIMHLHGTWGNFYGNPFIDHFAEAYPSNGYSFLTVNNRGHDEGSITERIRDSIKDVDTWLKFAADQGYRKVVLQGHSLGALKAVHYVRNTDLSASPVEIPGIVLLSPFDAVAFNCKKEIDKREEKITKTEALAATDPNQLVPADLWDMWLISAGTFLELIGKNTEADIFPFRKGNLNGSMLSYLTLPVFAAVGGNDFAAFPSPEAEYNQLRALANVQTVLIDGGPHNFAGHELALIARILPWLQTVLFQA